MILSNHGFPIPSALGMIPTFNNHNIEVSYAVLTNTQFTQLRIVYTSFHTFILTSNNNLTEELHRLLFKGDSHQLRTIHTSEHHLFIALLSK